jgi:hypothetical protein
VQTDRDEAAIAETVEAEHAPADANPVMSVTKLLTLTDQAVFVVAADWSDADCTLLRRVYRNGYAFAGPGGYQARIHRANIKREVLPRGGAAKPVPIAAAPEPVALPAVAPDAFAERLAQLERIVAGITAPAAQPDARDAEIERLQGLVVALTAERDALQRLVTDSDALDRRPDMPAAPSIAITVDG